MKKILLILLLFFIINVKALEKSIYNYTSGVNGAVIQKSFMGNLNRKENKESLIISSNTGIYIKNSEGNKYIPTNQKPVSVVMVDDINKDKYNDIVYAVNSKNGLYNIVAVSVVDDTIIWNKVLSKKTYVPYARTTIENIVVYKIEKVGNTIVVISDYSLYVLDVFTGKELFKYKDSDNIWDVTEVKDINNNLSEEIALSNQLGEVKLIDSNTGIVLWNSKVVENIKIKKDDILFDVKRNVWQVEFFDDALYAMGEDGTVYILDYKTGKLKNKLEVYKFDKEVLDQYYINEGIASYKTLNPTSKISEYFNNFSMKFIDDKLVVSAFLNATDRNKEYSIKPRFIVVDLKKLNILYDIEIPNIKLVNVEALYLDTNILVPIEVKEGYLYLNTFELETGKKLNETKVFLGTSVSSESKNHIYLQSTKDGVLIEQVNGFSVILDNNYKDIKINNNSYANAKIIKSNNDELYVSYESNGITYRIVKYSSLENIEPTWEYIIPNDMNNNGLFSISSSNDFNKDGVNDITALINKVDEENRVIATYFLILDSKTGSVIKFKSIHTGSYMSNGKKIDTYLTGTNLVAIKDMNKDGISELLIDSTIINGSNISMYGMFDMYLNVESSKLLNVGDINNDYINDLVVIESAQALLFTSKISGNIINYVKTNKKVTYPKDVLNLDYSIIIPDLNNDGIKEIVINDRNTDKKQIYRILSGKDLSTIFTISGLGYYGSSYIFLNSDINEDGFNDLVEVVNGINYILISGKDGTTLFKIEQELKDEYIDVPIRDASSSKDIYYEGIMNFIYEEANFSVISGMDINNDNKNELYLLKEEYYPQTKLVLEIYDINNKSKKPIRSVDIFFESNNEMVYKDVINNSEYSYLKQIVEVVNGNGLYIIKPPGDISIIYDAKEDKLLSEVDGSFVKAIKTSDDKIFGVTFKNSPISINFKNDFLVNNIKNNSKNKSPLKVSLNETLKENMRVVKVYNKGTLLSTEYNDKFDLLLKRGEYNLLFKATDRWGKTQNYELDITINKTNPYLILTTVIGIIIILLLVYLSIGHKLKRKLIMRRIYG